MPLLTDRDRNIIKNRFDAELVNEVKLLFFTQGESPLAAPAQECPGCREEHNLLEELASISPKLRLEVHDFVADRSLVEEQQVEEIPALIITRNGNLGVRYYGMTSGYEFSALVEDIIEVSKGKSTLSAKTQQALASIADPVHIRVFVTPT